MTNLTQVKDVVTGRASRVSPPLSGEYRRQLTKSSGASALEPVDANEDKKNILDCEYLETDHEGHFIDKSGRKVTLKGINVDSGMKLPTNPSMPSYKGNSSDPNNYFFDGENVTFVGRPFPLEEAESHFQRIKSWGYNTVRYLLTWEAIEHSGPEQYDEEFIDYTIKMLTILHNVGGLYVFLEVHQDVWSRYSGGSGAPMWTFYAAGLQPRRFAATEAAILHNEARFQDKHNPEQYQKMLWTSNYKRLASLVMFTLFFAGDTYFPRYKINGVNIQHYLQDRFYSSMKHCWERVVKGVPSEMITSGTLLGFESMNEPNCGLVGHDHLGRIPAAQQLRVGTTPTVYQTFRLGMGLPCDVDSYRITISGPQRYASKVVDPQGARAWMNVEEAAEIDAKYGWKRSKSWEIGTCLFAQAKIWTFKQVDFEKLPNLTVDERLFVSSRNCELLLPNYFNQVYQKQNFKDPPSDGRVTMDYFVNHHFVDFYLRHKQVVREVLPNAFVLIQPPVLEVPPNLKGDPREVIDNRTIYCPHYYDGMSLMFKTWNTKYNVDTLGIMRGKYLNPILGIVFGERAIRNCLTKQLLEIKRESSEMLGSRVPVLMSETGMPYDMDEKKAYTTGKYTSQTGALDALSYALEGSQLNHTYWCYNSDNCHQWGDRWNNEDFSFWSPEDRNEEAVQWTQSHKKGVSLSKLKAQVKSTVRSGEPTKSSTPSSGESYDSKADEEDSDQTSLQLSSLISCKPSNVQYRHNQKCYPSPDGVRAVSAVVRPFLLASAGSIKSSLFDLKNVTFSLTIAFDDVESKETPTIIFVPKWHYPYLDSGDLCVTSGYVKYNERLEYIEWHHDDGSSETASLVAGEETLTIKNNSGSLEDSHEDRGLFPCAGELSCPIS
ncbi:ergosteryl-beta-glucosidase [[Candida] anglica]|uniref:Ergosteryl-beta-glucosidase n=1 Tax=[Candida] anglica TaxID=148631 RepID=A0ABP0ED57_9ASCO